MLVTNIWFYSLIKPSTFVEAPSPPTAPLEISCITPHSIMVEWGAPESDGGAPLEGYKVAVRDAKRQMWMEVGRVQADVQKLQVKDLAVSLTGLNTIFQDRITLF